ncbi:TPA: hypothetical protein ACNVTQ_000715 [Morganella morganii]
MKKIILLTFLVLFGVSAQAREKVPDCTKSHYEDIVMESLKKNDDYLRGHKVLLKVQRTTPEVIKIDYPNDAIECAVVMRMANTRGTVERMFVHQFRLTYKTQNPNDLSVYAETLSFKRL